MSTTGLLFRNYSKPTLNSNNSLQYSSSSSSPSNIKMVRFESKVKQLKSDNYQQKINGIDICGNGKRKQIVAVQTSVAASESIVISEPRTLNRRISDLVEYVNHSFFIILRKLLKGRSLSQRIQMFIEKTIFNCRFFTLFAVAGCLIGSVLCFLEGCFIILESYFQYLHSISQKSDQGHIMHLLIEGIDMYLMGTAMLIFGVGLYTMFVGHSSKTIEVKGSSLSGSNLFGLFHMKLLPTWVQMQSVSQAKSKLGHAVTMILQVGVLEKFKSIPLVTPLDLACFAGAVLMSSACIFLLSRLSMNSFRR